MWFNGSLSSLSVLVTYFLQVIAVYLVARFICVFVEDARTRVRIWGVFLALTTGMWLFLWLPAKANSSVHSALHSVSLSGAVLQVALPAETWWVSHLIKFVPVTTYVYVLVLLASLLHLVLRSAQLRAVLRETEPPSPQLQLLFRRICRELNIERCELGIASGLRSPATCYWWRSHVLLPLELLPDLDTKQLDDILRHELMHVRGHDYLWDRLAALGCRLVFFHPLVWLGYRHLRSEREFACDYAVVREQIEARLRYAECLTSLARWLLTTNNSSSGIGFFTSDSLLALRVRVLLREPSVGSAPRRAARVGLVSIVASGAIILVPSLGLSLYSPIRMMDLLSQPERPPVNFARKNAAGTKRSLSSQPKEPPLEWMAYQNSSSQSITSLLNIGPGSLPSLGSSANRSDDETNSARVHDGVTSPKSNAIWDEAPAPLASPPKWRTLVVGAITGGVGIAAGRVDVDDDDGPHKRSR